ncbi:MAG: zinc-dependent metalloprotease [Porphyromonadaceae bacterium]|nr:zinc-dependent metalloprotease [Porphyromonadaceae bacterium]
MKVLNVYLLLWVTLLFVCPVAAQQDVKPMTYEQFKEQKDLQTDKGFYTVYRLNDKYYLEIPAEGLGKEVLITTQIARGMAAFVSEASGVIRFSEGRNNTVQVVRNRLTDVSADSTDICMMMALKKSGLVPIDYTFPIVARGEDSKSVIIELTGELNNPGSGLFNVSSYYWLSHPDPSRSGVDGWRMLDKGVVFSVTRGQTDYQSNPQTKEGRDMSARYILEMVIQQLPGDGMNRRISHPAYGFETIGVTEYDTKRYMAQKREYIQKWNLTAPAKEMKKQKRGIAIEPERQICVYIDPVTPAPFAECIKNGVKQWGKAFEAAGWKNVFRFSSDVKDASLTYRTILFRWGSAYNGIYSSVIDNPVTGEILCARVNVMDVAADELLGMYFLQCGLLDGRIRKDLHSLAVRQEVLTAQVASAFAEVLKMKPNKTGYTVFTPTSIRSEKWLNRYGITASITSGVTFNYLAQPGDGVSVKNLFPRVSVYDYDAIKYAYGNSDALPSMRGAFYAPEDKGDPYAQDGFLSNDILNASIQGIEAVKRIYPRLSEWINQLPEDQNTWKNVSDFTVKAQALFQTYLTQIVKLVGGRSVRPIIKGGNETRVTYVPREQQEEALNYLESAIFGQFPEWVRVKELDQSGVFDTDQMMVGLAEALLKHFMNKEVMESLVAGERRLGEKAFTARELFAYLDRVVFENFDPNKAVSTYKQGVQACFVSEFARFMAQNNISFGLSNGGNGVYHAYFVELARKVKDLSEQHQDPLTRSNYQMMLLRMNREYFDKQ